MSGQTSPATVQIALPDGCRAGWPTLLDAFERAREATGLEMTFGGLIDQVRMQTMPKPPEPTNYLAVVRTSRGVRYWRWAAGNSATSSPWRLLGAVHADTEESDGNYRWDELEVAEVISLGVEP